MSQVTGQSNAASTTISFLVGYFSSLIYELLLASLALWACIQCFRGPFNQGEAHLRVILLKGNLMCFLE